MLNYLIHYQFNISTLDWSVGEPSDLIHYQFNLSTLDWSVGEPSDLIHYQFNISTLDWSVGEPSDGGNHEDCAMFWNSHGWSWNDYTCSNSVRHICEMVYVLFISELNYHMCL